ncbi:hypothetical protein, partial [Streptococcus pneumoniae]|uniref:hypothetical protein n=1 Tax=Streptococcus pneumoniae TaxID=1313 RepID=UPI0018B0A26C
AKSEAGAVSGKLAGGKPAMPDFSPDSLDAGLQQAAAKVDVKGSFSAAALAGLGAGDTANDQLKEQKTSNKHLAKIASKIDDAELAFS